MQRAVDLRQRPSRPAARHGLARDGEHAPVDVSDALLCIGCRLHRPRPAIPRRPPAAYRVYPSWMTTGPCRGTACTKSRSAPNGAGGCRYPSPLRWRPPGFLRSPPPGYRAPGRPARTAAPGRRETRRPTRSPRQGRPPPRTPGRGEAGSSFLAQRVPDAANRADSRGRPPVLGLAPAARAERVWRRRGVGGDPEVVPRDHSLEDRRTPRRGYDARSKSSRSENSVADHRLDPGPRRTLA